MALLHAGARRRVAGWPEALTGKPGWAVGKPRRKLFFCHAPTCRRIVQAAFSQCTASFQPPARGGSGNGYCGHRFRALEIARRGRQMRTTPPNRRQQFIYRNK